MEVYVHAKHIRNGSLPSTGLIFTRRADNEQRKFLHTVQELNNQQFL
jgi:hypothetical protein